MGSTLFAAWHCQWFGFFYGKKKIYMLELKQSTLKSCVVGLVAGWHGLRADARGRNALHGTGLFPGNAPGRPAVHPGHAEAVCRGAAVSDPLLTPGESFCKGEMCFLWSSTHLGLQNIAEYSVASEVCSACPGLRKSGNVCTKPSEFETVEMEKSSTNLP